MGKWNIRSRSEKIVVLGELFVAVGERECGGEILGVASVDRTRGGVRVRRAGSTNRGARIRAGRRAIPLLGGTDGFSDGAGSGEKRRRKLIGGCSGWMVKAPRTRSVSTEA